MTPALFTEEDGSVSRMTDDPTHDVGLRREPGEHRWSLVETDENAAVSSLVQALHKRGELLKPGTYLKVIKTEVEPDSEMSRYTIRLSDKPIDT